MLYLNQNESVLFNRIKSKKQIKKSKAIKLLRELLLKEVGVAQFEEIRRYVETHPIYENRPISIFTIIDKMSHYLANKYLANSTRM